MFDYSDAKEYCVEPAPPALWNRPTRTVGPEQLRSVMRQIAIIDRCRGQANKIARNS
ncbi:MULTISPECIES: hypothetical protein [unclassified Mesorhizobium]|uniref:hypothetical protein n=1 Tax=unclassified Mesorhizobium TaxID=325217 RepID=UPI0013EDD1CE|nr:MULTISPECIES: hypothetical protein [unclassified Mesorhizobium]